MATSIDDFGDPGVGPRCSPVFALTAVHFETEAVEVAYLSAVAIHREATGFADEFHFTHTADRHRRAFFEMAARLPFGFAVAYLVKPPPSKWVTAADQAAAVAGALAGEMVGWYRIAEGCKPDGVGLNERVVYDHCNSKAYTTALRDAFTSLPSSPGRAGKLVRSIKPGDSATDPRVQLADMIGAAVARHLSGDDEYYRLIRGREYAIRRVLVVGNEEGADDP